MNSSANKMEQVLVTPVNVLGKERSEIIGIETRNIELQKSVLLY